MGDPYQTILLLKRLAEAMEERKRKISVEGPPDGEEDDVIGPLPVGGGGGAKKRKGRLLIWREI